nr:transposase, MuDR, MULE transposase domain protein [Tanacetum cinerariifolium]GEY13202.1 transposase, MuDR, MULE transposase domain protein [Tanacetum cinerariifolium]
MFFVYEWSGMLKELGLGDNNKILFTYFRIHGMSLDDGFVLLMANSDVIKLWNYVIGCKEVEVYIKTGVSLVELHLVELVVSQSQIKGVGKGVVVEEIVEDNVASISGKESGLLMLEWHEMGKEEVISRSGKESRLLMLEWLDMGKEDKHVDTSTHASTSDVCQVVEPMINENDFGVDVVDMEELYSGDVGDDEQPPQIRKRILREIRREYAGKANIKEALGWVLEGIHVTWANLEKKRTRLRTYTKSLEDLCIHCVETASQAYSDAIVIYMVTASGISRRR